MVVTAASQRPDQPDRSALSDLGWHQGAVIQLAPYLELLTASLGCVDLRTHMTDSTVGVVISHDCDIANANEPVVELLIGETIAERSQLGSFNKANPRVFVLDMKQALIVRICNRASVSRDDLLELNQLANSLDCVFSKERFRTWLSRRYSRPAWEDKVQLGLINPLFEQLNSWRKKYKVLFETISHDLIQVRVGVEEHEGGINGKVLVLLDDENDAMTPEASDAAEDLIDYLKATRLSDGIILESVEPIPLTELYLIVSKQMPELQSEWMSFDGDVQTGAFLDPTP